LKLREARRYGRAFSRGLRQTMTTLIDGKASRTTLAKPYSAKRQET
jgi:hypothetical protein